MKNPGLGVAFRATAGPFGSSCSERSVRRSEVHPRVTRPWLRGTSCRPAYVPTSADSPLKVLVEKGGGLLFLHPNDFSETSNLARGICVQVSWPKEPGGYMRGGIAGDRDDPRDLVPDDVRGLTEVAAHHSEARGDDLGAVRPLGAGVSQDSHRVQAVRRAIDDVWGSDSAMSWGYYLFGDGPSLGIWGLCSRLGLQRRRFGVRPGASRGESGGRGCWGSPIPGPAFQ